MILLSRNEYICMGKKYVLVKMIEEIGHLTRIQPWVEDLVCNSNMLRRRIRKSASSLSSHLCNKIMMEGCKKAKKRPKFNRSKKFNTFTWLILVCSNAFSLWNGFCNLNILYWKLTHFTSLFQENFESWFPEWMDFRVVILHNHIIREKAQNYFWFREK